MDIYNFSSKYSVKTLKETDINDILKLYLSNPVYYKYCPTPASKESVLEDMTGLPPNKTIDDKFFVGYYEKERLVAVLDLLTGYPENSVVFLGFFMLHKDFQGKGIGVQIIQEIIVYIKELGFSKIRLAIIKGNEPAKNFWLRNNFELINVEREMEDYTAVFMEHYLQF